MGTYQAGDLTKEKIYQISREVFYESGYNNASMKEVCLRAGVKQSVFYYHYNDKSTLAKMLYSNFGIAHSSGITNEIINFQQAKDIIKTNCVCSALLILNSIEDPHIGKFWAEMYTDNLTADIKFHRHFHENLYKKIYPKYDPVYFEFFLINSSSINCALMLSYLDGRLKTTSEQVARFKTEHTLRNLNFQQDEIKEITDEVLKIAKCIPIKVGKNFEISLNGKILF